MRFHLTHLSARIAILLIFFAGLFSANAQQTETSKKADPKSLKFTKWTSAFQVPDPVAISFDEKGRAYVTQTQRRKANDLDIRANRDWIPNDLSFQSPDDKRAFYKEKFTPENSEANKDRVEDLNKDGKHDIEDLRMLSERIYRIEDTNGDGHADKKVLYADGFNDEIAGIAAGVLYHEGNVYTTILPDVWKMRDNDDDGKADTRESMVYGFGAHLAYAGHDMHGLKVGPDGRIYWTIGDKGVNVKSKEGIQFKFPNQGALLRCDPDGSNFEVYAHGLRNVQEIAFDQYGNIFGVDNDSDRPGEKERFVYIVQHMDAGWRSNWQYRSSDEFNPWMDENMSIPFHDNQPGHITPALSLYNNGPAGMAFNPGTALSPEWHNYFFHTNAPNGQQWAFQVEEVRASYKMVNDMQIGNGVPIVGINFAPDGALYGVDWGGGYPLNEQGAVWKWDVEVNGELKAEREEVATLLASDFSTAETEMLKSKLGNPDQRVRLKSQFELVNRGEREVLEKVATTQDSTPEQGEHFARIHAIWGIGQLNRKAEKPEFETLSSLLEDSTTEIRTQAAKTIGDFFGVQLATNKPAFPIKQGLIDDRTLLVRKLIPLLKDKSDRVKFHAAIAIGNLGVEEGAQPILDMVNGLDNANYPYLRHAAVMGLTGCASPEFLASIYDETFDLAQDVAVVAMRRRGDANVAKFLNALTSGVSEDAARAIHDDWTIPEAMPALAEALETTKLIKSEPLVRRAINANFRLGESNNAERVAAFAARKEVPEALRLDALDALANWTEPDVLDRVVGRYRPLEMRDPAIAADAVSAHLGDLLTDASSGIRTESMSLARGLKIQIDPDTLLAITNNRSAKPALKIEAMRGLAAQNSDKLTAALDAAWNAPEPEIRVEALKLLAKSNTEQAMEKVRVVLESKVATFSEKQTAIGLLAGDLASDAGDSLLKPLIEIFQAIPGEIQLDLAEAAAARNLGGPAPDFPHTLAGGDAKRGKDIFINNLAAQCIRCHKVDDGKGSSIGPNLKSIGLKKDRAYVLESLVDPQKVISNGYGTISLTLKNGDSIAGQFRGEKDGIIELRDPEGKSTKVKSDDVKDRTPVVSTMPPMGLILQKREVRDLIEFLASLKAPDKK